MTAQIRLRLDADLRASVRLLETIRADGYPTHWPDDPESWLTPRGLLGAWVAEEKGRIAGHIALRAGAADSSASVWSHATGLPPERFAAISRLFVSPDDRCVGVGRALLDVACGEAVKRGLQAALDVVETNRDAIRLYERCGWRHLGSQPWALALDRTLLHYYISPPVE